METVWITGASSGIGEACAYAWAASGASLILTSSSLERLAPVGEKCRKKGAKDVVILPYDLRDPDGIGDLVRKAWDAFGGSMDMIRQIMEINYFAPAAIARELLPLMEGRGGGHIAVTTSIAGRFGFPLRCGYSSSKFALYGFFETLQAEAYGRGIRVTIVCPGRVRTPISLRALDKGGKPHGRMDPGQEGGISPEKAARTIVRAVRKGRCEVLVGGGELAMVYVKRFFPGLCARLARKIKPV